MPEREVIQRIFQLKQQCDLLEEGLRESLQLSSAEFQVLRLIGAEALSCGDYAARTGRSASRMTRVVDGLVARDLVLRVAGSDRRTLMLELTEAGRSAQAEIVACESRCDNRLRERLGTKGYNEAVRVLGGLIEHTADTAAITGA
jgi:DNA-binding MarR family transcriptional regulator